MKKNQGPMAVMFDLKAELAKYNVRQVDLAEHFGISKQLIQCWIKRGAIGRGWYFAITAFLENSGKGLNKP